MNDNYVEKIIENVLSNEKYLKSEKRLYRLALSNLQKGLMTVYGEKKIGKRLFIINMINSILDYNNAEVLFVTDKLTKEEMAIRIATSRAGNNPFILARRIGVDKAINENINYNEKIRIIEKNKTSSGLIREILGMSNARHKIVVFDDVSIKDLNVLKKQADELGIIIIVTTVFPNDCDRPNYVALNNILMTSDVALEIKESYHDYKNECIKVSIIKNMSGEKDTIKMVVNQYRQRLFDTYEINVYDDEELPF